MVVEVHKPVCGEEVLEAFVAQRVRVVRPKDHQVRHVHDSHAELGDFFAEDSGGGDDFERELDANTDENATGFPWVG